jgi:hypothetical protein
MNEYLQVWGHRILPLGARLSWRRGPGHPRRPRGNLRLDLDCGLFAQILAAGLGAQCAGRDAFHDGIGVGPGGELRRWCQFLCQVAPNENIAWSQSSLLTES